MKPYGNGAQRIIGPSTLHRWRVVAMPRRPNGSGHYAVEFCDRCERRFVEAADATGPVWCSPTTAWLAGHPGDEEQR